MKLSNYLLLALIIALNSCSNNSKTEVKIKQYMVKGQMLYNIHCSNCHGINGQGLGRVYPPLNPSDYMQNNYSDVLCIMRSGLTGELLVNGVSYNQMMPALEHLTDLEVAEIATYIYNSWSDKKGLIGVNEVIENSKNCLPPTAH